MVAQGAFQGDFIGQDIKAGAAGDGAEGEDGRGTGVFALGKDGLEQGQGLGGEGDGVDAVVGGGGVGVTAADFQAELIGPGHDEAGAVADLADGEHGGDMEAGDGGDLVQDAKLDHEFGAAHRAGGQTFFGGLQDKAETAGELFPEPGEQFSGAQGDGQVKIVAAGVHDAGVLGGPGFVRRFGDGQGVHIGPPGKGGAGLGADEVGDDAVAGDVRFALPGPRRPDKRRRPGRCAPPGWKVRDAGENPGGGAGAPGRGPGRAGQ